MVGVSSELAISGDEDGVQAGIDPRAKHLIRCTVLCQLGKSLAVLRQLVLIKSTLSQLSDFSPAVVQKCYR